MKKQLASFILLFGTVAAVPATTLSLGDFAAFEDVYTKAGPVFVSPETTILQFDWSISWQYPWPANPGRLDEIWDWLQVSCAPTSDQFQTKHELWSGNSFDGGLGRTWAYSQSDLPLPQSGSKSIDLSSWQGQNINIYFTVAYNSAWDTTSDASGYFRNAELVPEPGVPAMLTLSLCGLGICKKYRRVWPSSPPQSRFWTA